MKEIKLTQGKFAIVDDDDFKKLNQYKWHTCVGKNTFYAIRSVYKINGKQTTIRMHREIMNAPKDIKIDHKFHNGLDNRKENLRFCNTQQNNFNRKTFNKNNKLGVKGVCWHNDHKKFMANIQIDNKIICLGYFNVLGDADSVYRIAEEKYFGEFARKC